MKYIIKKNIFKLKIFSLQDFISILPTAKGQVSAPTNEFIITFKKGKQAFEEYFLNSLEPS